MRNYLVFFLLLPAMLCLSGKSEPAATVPTFKNCQKCIVLSEQSQNRVAILDLDQKAIVWEWRPENSNIRPEHVAWFKLPSDAKAVYGGTCILTTASGGGVALIRIADKKVLFYAEAGNNPHSPELLPDGNIVSASSNGNYLKIFRVDTVHFPEKVYSKTIPIASGHNVVWDKKRQLLWSAGMDQLKSFTYNFDCRNPELSLKDSVPLIGTQAHDLFPVYGQDALWLTNAGNTYTYSITGKKLTVFPLPWHDVKSMSSGPKGYPVIAVHPDGTPKGWWTDEIYSSDAKVLFKQPGFKLYKARWFVENEFSYKKGTALVKMPCQ